MMGEAEEDNARSESPPPEADATASAEGTPANTPERGKRRNSLVLQIDTVKVQINALKEELKVKEAQLAILQKQVRHIDGDSTTDKIKTKLAHGAQTTKATLSSAATKLTIAAQASKEKLEQWRRERAKSSSDKKEETDSDAEFLDSDGNHKATAPAANGDNDSKATEVDDTKSRAEGARSRSFTERMRLAGDSLKAKLKSVTAKKDTPAENGDESKPSGGDDGHPPAQMSPIGGDVEGAPKDASAPAAAAAAVDADKAD